MKPDLNTPQPLPAAPPPQAPVSPQHSPTRKIIRPDSRPYDRRRQRSFSWSIAFFTIAAGLVLFVLIMAAYMFFYQPRVILADYVRKLAEVKTGSATGSLSFKNAKSSNISLNNISSSQLSNNISSLLTNSDINFAARYDVRNVNNPVLETKFTFGLSGVTTDIDTLVDNKSFYLKLADNPLITLAGISISHNWFRMALPANTFNKSACTLQDQEHSILSRNVLRFMPIKSVRRKKLYETVKGRRTIHTTGEVNMKKLGQAIAQANSGLPESCRIIFDAKQAQNTSAFYDLYSSNDFDRLSVTVIDHSIGRESDVIMDTENYGQDFQIDTPTTTNTIRSLSEIFKNR